MTLDALLAQHLLTGPQRFRGRQCGTGRLVQARLREECGHAVAVLLIEQPAGRHGLAKRRWHRDPDQHEAGDEQRRAQGRYERGVQPPEEPHDGDLQQQDHADRHAQTHVDGRARREFDLVGPQPRDHLPHQQQEDRQEHVAADAVGRHDLAAGGLVRFRLLPVERGKGRFRRTAVRTDPIRRQVAPTRARLPDIVHVSAHETAVSSGDGFRSGPGGA